MIRINLLPVKRRKKAKPLPSFLVSVILAGVVLLCVLAYLSFYFHSTLRSTRAQFEGNKQKIAALKEKIQEVDGFEKLNKTFDERNKIIEQFRKNQNIPVLMLDEISRQLPNGVWLQAMNVSGDTVNLEGYAFTNTEVVAYVDNLKNSKKFSDIFLQESKQVEIEKIPLYLFKVTFKVAV